MDSGCYTAAAAASLATSYPAVTNALALTSYELNDANTVIHFGNTTASTSFKVTAGQAIIEKGATVDATAMTLNSDSRAAHANLINHTSGDGLLKLGLGTSGFEAIIHSDTAPLNVGVNVEYTGTVSLQLVGKYNEGDTYATYHVMNIAAGKTLTMTDGTFWAKRSIVNVYGTLDAKYVQVGHEASGTYPGQMNIKNGGMLKTQSVKFMNYGGNTNSPFTLEEGGTLEFTQDTNTAFAKVSNATYSVNLSGGTLKASVSSWHVDDGVAMNIGNVTIDTAEDSSITLSNALTLTGPITNNGTLTLGQVPIAAESSVFPSKITGYSGEDGNGYPKTQYTVFSTVGTISGNGAGKVKIGTSASSTEYTLDGGKFSIDSTGGTYYINSGSKTYSTIATDATTAITLNSGTLELDQTLAKPLTVVASSTINIGKDATLDKSKVTISSGTVTLTGSGTYVADGMNMTGVTLATGENGWTGRVVISGTVLSTNLNFSIYANGTYSTVVLNGVNGYLTTGTNTFSENLELTNNGSTAAFDSSDGGNGDARTFSGTITGTGNFLRSNKGQSQTFKFTGDVSGWTGNFKATNTQGSGFPTTVEFSDSATTINVGISHASATTPLNLVTSGSNAKTFNGSMAVSTFTANGGDVTFAGEYLALEGALSGTANISIASGSTLVLSGDGRTNSLSNVTFAEGSKLSLVSTIGDDGTITLTNVSALPANAEIEVVASDLTTKLNVLSSTVTDDKLVVRFTPMVSGVACWYDFTFTNTLTSVGQNKGGLTRDTTYGIASGTSAYTSDGTAIFAAIDGYMTPSYNGTSGYPTEWSASVYAQMPAVSNAVLMAFGTRTGGSIALIAGDTNKNEVILARTTDNSAYTNLTSMTVPNAYKTKHLYSFCKTAQKITIYLDEAQWAVYTSESSISFGAGFQLGSLFDGLGYTGYVQYGNTYYDSQTEANNATIGMLRMYDVALGPKAISALASEFQYVSPDSYTRTVETASSVDWVSTGAWTKGSEAVAEPPDGSAVVFTANDATSVSVNLDADKTYESVQFKGTGPITLTLAEGKEVAIKTVQVKIDTAVTIENGAADLSTAVTSFGDAGSLTVDFSGMDCSKIHARTVVEVTGTCSDSTLADRIHVTEPTAKYGRVFSVVYQTSNNKYAVVVDIDPAITTLYWNKANTEFTEDTLFLKEADGTTQIAYYPGLPIVVTDGGTMKFTFLPTAACAVTVNSGATVDLNGLQPTEEVKNFAITLNGGTLTNTGSDTAIFKSLTLTADSTVNVSGCNINLQSKQGGWATTTIALDTYTLTKSGTADLLLVTTTVTGKGTIDVTAGKLYLQEGSSFGESTVKIGANGTFEERNGLTSSISKITGEGGYLILDAVSEDGTRAAAALGDFTLTGTLNVSKTGTYGTITTNGQAAKVDGTEYTRYSATLDDAITTAKSGGTLVLLANVTDSLTFGATDTIRINTGTYSVTPKIVLNGGSVEAVKEGTLTSDSFTVSSPYSLVTTTNTDSTVYSAQIVPPTEGGTVTVETVPDTGITVQPGVSLTVPAETSTDKIVVKYGDTTLTGGDKPAVVASVNGTTGAVTLEVQKDGEVTVGDKTVKVQPTPTAMAAGKDADEGKIVVDIGTPVPGLFYVVHASTKNDFSDLTKTTKSDAVQATSAGTAVSPSVTPPTGSNVIFFKVEVKATK